MNNLYRYKTIHTNVIKNVLSRLVKHDNRNLNVLLQVQQRCSIYCSTSIGLERFKRQRLNLQYLKPYKETYVDRIEKHVNENKLIYTEDLKTIVTLADNKREIDLAVNMLCRYTEQFRKKNVAINWSIGPQIMRLCYLHNLWELGYKLLTDPNLQAICNSVHSYHVLMDLLYENGEHDKNIEVFEHLQKNTYMISPYPNNCFTILCASLLQQNTIESYEIMVKHVSKFEKPIMSHRCACFCCWLALKQSQPQTLFRIMNLVKVQYVNHKILVNCKIKAYIQMKQLDDAFNLLKKFVPANLVNLRANVFVLHVDILQELETSLLQCDDMELRSNLSTFITKMKENNYVSYYPLETFILLPIATQLFDRAVVNSYANDSQDAD